MINIYVGNLPYNTSEGDLEQLFGQFGEVVKAAIIMDRETGRSRGFGFVEMTDPELGRKAVEALHGSDFGGRSLTVNEAKPREPRRGGGFGGGGGGGGGSSYGAPSPGGYSSTSGSRGYSNNRND